MTQIHPIEFLCNGIWPQNCPFKQCLFTLEEKKDHLELGHGETVWVFWLFSLVLGTDDADWSGPETIFERLLVFWT